MHAEKMQRVRCFFKAQVEAFRSSARAGTAGKGARWCIVSLSAWGTWAAASITALGKEDFLPAISGGLTVL